MTQMATEFDFQVLPIDADLVQIKIKSESYVLDYSSLMDLIFQMTQTASAMEQMPMMNCLCQHEGQFKN